MARILNAVQIDSLLSSGKKFPTLKITSLELKKDIRNLATDVYLPLTGFLKQDDFESVVNKIRLTNGAIWPIPIILDIDASTKNRLKRSSEVLLNDEHGHPLALLSDIEIYSFDREKFAQKVFGTKDKLHPGVEAVYQLKEFLIGGEVQLINTDKLIFHDYNFTPAETKRIFTGRGWRKIVAFQTRNVPHRGHEFLQKQALKEVDGLFIHPIIGEKKLQDFKDEYIISSYEKLVHQYYPKHKVVLGVLPLKMRYAGPREAVFHALVRRNFGCTHFIVGRDHAGVGQYYSPYAAQEIFDQLPKTKLGIEILKFEEVVWDKKNLHHNFLSKVAQKNRVQFSGTKLRKYIANQQKPPSYLMRPEVYQVLTDKRNVLVDDMYQQQRHKVYKNHQGFVLWLTGLSQSGKSTIAERLFEVLEDKNINAELLDGDVVRESLSRNLGFSKHDRDENIRRVAFVAKLLSRNRVGVVCSFISPYKAQRQRVAMQVENFIEVFVNTPLAVCERWDKKGFYKKARDGEIKNFTGISAPYEKPTTPDLELRPAEMGVDVCVQEILEFLERKKLL